jgi:Xaa-Pro aminopeptidase
VRIEDDALVTTGGCEVLTSKAPKTIAGIEQLMKRTHG